MAPYNVMITEANSEMGMEFVRQLLTLPHPPEYIFAAYTTEENANDLIIIQEGSKYSKLILCGIDTKRPVEGSIEEIKTVIEQVIGNKGLDLLINVIRPSNDEHDLMTSIENLESRFHTSTLSPLMLFQIMLPLLKEAALRNSEYNQESKSIFFNIIQDNSAHSNPISQINEMALNLAMTVMEERVKNNNVLVLSTCLCLEQDDEIHESELEKYVTSNLLYALCSSQIENSTVTDSSTVCKL